MIIIGFGCGLGNQMFQYAFYLSMVEQYPQVQFKADTQYAFIEEHNGFELDRVFGINFEECTINERKKLSEFPIRKNCINEIFLKIRNRLKWHKKSFYKQYDYTEYYSEVYDLPVDRDMYLLGIWANEKYFKDLKSRLQKEVFIFDATRLNDVSREVKERIESAENSVSIHVRRGDFVEYQNHVMGKQYYQKAMEIMENTIGHADYFVFSDDVDYARELFGHSLNVFYVQGNVKANSWMDMYLMSICHHNIIANSSFSFWGAYLNQNDSKIVIAPNRPFVNCRNSFTCEEWITVNCPDN